MRSQHDERLQRDGQHAFHVVRPNQLWVADFTYIVTWSGMVYVGFVMAAISRSIAGWRTSSDRGSQYLSIRYTERLAEAGIKASVGRKGDAYDGDYAGAASRRPLTLHTMDVVSSR